MPANHKYFGELLLEKGLVTEEQLLKGLELQKEKEGRLGELLCQLKVLREEDCLQALSEQLQVPIEPHLEQLEINLELIKNVPINFAKQYQLLPLIREGDRVRVGGQAGVAQDVKPGEVVSGCPAFPHREWLRAQVVFPRLPEIKKNLSALEKRVEELEKILWSRENPKDER